MAIFFRAPAARRDDKRYSPRNSLSSFLFACFCKIALSQLITSNDFGVQPYDNCIILTVDDARRRREKNENKLHNSIFLILKRVNLAIFYNSVIVSLFFFSKHPDFYKYFEIIFRTFFSTFSKKF